MDSCNRLIGAMSAPPAAGVLRLVSCATLLGRDEECRSPRAMRQPCTLRNGASPAFGSSVNFPVSPIQNCGPGSSSHTRRAQPPRQRFRHSSASNQQDDDPCLRAVRVAASISAAAPCTSWRAMISSRWGRGPEQLAIGIGQRHCPSRSLVKLDRFGKSRPSRTSYPSPRCHRARGLAAAGRRTWRCLRCWARRR